MAVAASSIITRAQIALQDADGVRWPAQELVLYLNDAQYELVRLRPDQKASTVVVTLNGYRHTLPNDAVALVDIPANVTGNRKRITQVAMKQLDAVLPNWRNRPPSSEIVHYMYDLRNPLEFYTYPAGSNAQVEMVYARLPASVPSPTGATASSVSGNIDVPDVWADALLNYVLFRAYSKDAEFGGNSQLAASYLALFNTAIGLQSQAAATVVSKP